MWREGRGALLESLREWLPGIALSLGGGPLGGLREAGLLGPRTLLVHSNYLTGAEIKEAGEAGCPVVHCPLSHAYFRHRKFSWQALKKAGCPILLGTDSAATGGGPDLAGSLRLGLESSDASPEDLWFAATRGGAEALGLGDLTGSLRLGFSADAALIGAPGANARNLAEKMLEGRVQGSVIQGQLSDGVRGR